MLLTSEKVETLIAWRALRPPPAPRKTTARKVTAVTGALGPTSEKY